MRRRLRSLVLTLGEHMRERWAEERAAGRLGDWGERNTDDLIDLLTNPAAAGALSTLHELSKKPGALEETSKMLGTILDESSPATSRALLSYAADALQALPGDESANALLRALATAAAANVDAVLAGSQSTLDVQRGLLYSNAFMLGESAKADGAGVIGKVLANLVRMPGQAPRAGSALPISVLFDAVLDINRLDPSKEGSHGAEDYRAAFTRMAEVMTDERRGFERLYRIVQCATSAGAKADCD